MTCWDCPAMANAADVLCTACRRRTDAAAAARAVRDQDLSDGTTYRRLMAAMEIGIQTLQAMRGTKAC